MEGVGDSRAARYKQMVAEFGIEKAKKVSSEDRFEQLGEVDCEMTPFVYGEITFEPIAEIIDMLECNDDKKV